MSKCAVGGQNGVKDEVRYWASLCHSGLPIGQLTLLKEYVPMFQYLAGIWKILFKIFL